MMKYMLSGRPRRFEYLLGAVFLSLSAISYAYSWRGETGDGRDCPVALKGQGGVPWVRTMGRSRPSRFLFFDAIARSSRGLIKVVYSSSTHAEVLVKSTIEGLGRYVGGIASIWEACPTCRQVLTGAGKLTGRLGECLIPNPLF
jgi:hypothetical protein